MSGERPVILAHPGLGGIASLFSAYEIARLPIEAEARAAFLAGPARSIEAAVVIGSIGLPRDAFAAMTALKLIASFGVGYDAIDVAACAARGVAVANCPDINHEDVADVALGLMLSCARHIAAGDRLVRSGGWTGPVAFAPPRRLRGRRLGVVGLGAIGKAVARRAEALGLSVAWTGPRPKPEAPWPYASSLQALAAGSDILALCLRPDPGTERMVGAAILEALGPEGMLINVSRGSVVDEEALIDALRSGRLGSAGLDVFAQEPSPMALWADVLNVTLTPHLAGSTRESILESVALVQENLRRHFAGEPLASLVNRP